MEPLAALHTTAPLPSLGQAQLAEEGRGSQADNAAQKERPVTLGQSRVDSSEATAQRPATRAPQQDHGDATALDSQKQLQDKISADRERAEAAAIEFDAKNQGVTYRIYPDLRRSQGRVIDRTTDDVVQAIPSERQIELALRYQTYIGQNLDTTA